MTLWGRLKHVTAGSLVFGALGAVGCEGPPRQAASEVQPSSALPEGIIRHGGPMPSPASGGRRVKGERALAAGQWDGPEQMYRATCAGCHDPAIAVGPPLLGRKLGIPYITTLARNGRNGMPGFFPSEFTDGELRTLAAWIDAQPAAPASQSPGGAP